MSIACDAYDAPEVLGPRLRVSSADMLLCTPSLTAVQDTGGTSAEALLSREWSRVKVGVAAVDCLTYPQAIDAVERLALRGRGRHYIVTPNIQHVVELAADAEFRAAYRGAALVLPDGAPVALAVRLLTKRAQGRVTGSDLLPLVCQMAAERGLTVGFLGGRPGAAVAAAVALTRESPELEVVLIEAPPRGFEHDPQELRGVLGRVRAADPDILFVGLGAPKQELFVHRHASELGHGAALCVGAAIDFTGGVVRRAPRAFRRVGAEWLWRVLREPRRLAGRYAHAGPRFLAIIGRQLIATRIVRRRTAS